MAPLTMALERYDRHVPFFNGTVQPPDGIEITPLEVGEGFDKRDGSERHIRMLRHLEFDIAELSLASYITEKSRNPDLPLIAVPCFPRRFFSMGQLYINADAGIETPADLAGKRMGCHAFQVTLSVLAKGDLKFEYGVPWERIHWFCSREEAVPITYPDGVSVERIPAGQDMGEMLISGALDAVISPQPPRSMLGGSPKVRRLFPDTKAEEQRYFAKRGYWPIMHLMAIKTDALSRHPDLPRVVMDMCERAKQIAYRFYEDSNYALLAWVRNAFEEQRATLGADPWPNGLAANRANLERFVMYCHDQGLIASETPLDTLFHASVLDS